MIRRAVEVAIAAALIATTWWLGCQVSFLLDQLLAQLYSL